MEKKLPKTELVDRRAGWYLEYSKFYFWFVESVAASRHEMRDATIEKWIEADQKKDERLASAHMAGGTYCLICGKDIEQIVLECGADDFIPKPFQMEHLLATVAKYVNKP